MQVARAVVCLVLASALPSITFAATQEAPSSKKPILEVPRQRLVVSTTGGRGFIPLYATIRGRYADLGRVYPGVKRAVIIVHGSRRNAAVYNNVAEYTILDSGQKNWNTLLITPEFLEQLLHQGSDGEFVRAVVVAAFEEFCQDRGLVSMPLG